MLFRKRRERELNEEIEAHFRMAVEERTGRGESPDAARSQARREFGSEALVKEVTRQMWGLETLYRLGADVRYAARMLRKSYGFTAVVVLTLALGIGANTAIFSVIHAALSPFAIPHPERVMTVLSEDPQRGWHDFPASVPDFLDWKAGGVFSGLAAFSDDGANLRLPDRTVRVDRLRVTADYCDVMASPPELGRYFTADEMHAGGPAVVVLSDDLWRARFGGAASVVGQSVVLDGVPHTVVGVVAKQFPKLEHEQVYTPLVFDAQSATSRGTRSLSVIGRLRDGLTMEAGARRMAEISARLAHDFPDDAGIAARLQPIEEVDPEGSGQLLKVLLGAVGFVLLIACANIANLVLARGTGRVREMTVRAALGAGRWRLVRQLLTENMVLGLGGGLLALLPAWAGIGFVKSFRIDSLPNADLISLNWSVLAFDLALALVTGLLFGIVPAWQALGLNMSETLKAGNRSATSGAHKRLRSTLVVGQIALALVLLAGAGLMIESFLHMRSHWPGYDSHQVLTMKIALADRQYTEGQKQAAFYDQVLARGRELPAVIQIGGVQELPLSDDFHGAGVYRPDRPTPRRSEVPIVLMNSATPGYFDAMRIPLRQGRWFSEADREGSALVAVIDEFAAQHLWRNENPIGKTLKLGSKAPTREIVGVVGSVDGSAILTLLAGQVGQVYLPLDQAPQASVSVVVRHSGDPAPLISAMRDAVRQIDVDQPLFEIRTMDELRGAGQLPEKLAAYLLGAFAAVALVLAGIGIYGVMAYSVGQRSREFGIRMALGAQPRDVWGAVLRQGSVLAAIGIGAGLAGSFVLTRLLGNLLFRIGAADPLTFAGVTILLAAVTLFAAWVPARRATRIDPVLTLREE